MVSCTRRTRESEQRRRDERAVNDTISTIPARALADDRQILLELELHHPVYDDLSYFLDTLLLIAEDKQAPDVGVVTIHEERGESFADARIFIPGSHIHMLGQSDWYQQE